MFDAEAIPLEKGEISDCSIKPNSAVEPGVYTALRCRRKHKRKDCSKSMLCFGRQMSCGRSDQAACPIVNISASGIAFEYDEQLEEGCKGFVAYRSVSGRPVQITCVVRQCRRACRGRYIIGVELDRKLQFDEAKPAYASHGREIAPNTRPRRLRDEGKST